MAETRSQTEGVPIAYPQLSGEAKRHLVLSLTALDEAWVWQRIDGHVAHRWSDRAVTWVVEGPGEWRPPLTPVTSSSAECWDGSAWQPVTVGPSPFGGFDLPGDGPYRFSCQVGAEPLPEVVAMAFVRLSNYCLQTLVSESSSGQPTIVPGYMRSFSRQDAVRTTTFERNENWMALALHNSGAADLLRPYRRA